MQEGITLMERECGTIKSAYLSRKCPIERHPLASNHLKLECRTLLKREKATVPGPTNVVAISEGMIHVMRMIIIIVHLREVITIIAGLLLIKIRTTDRETIIANLPCIRIETTSSVIVGLTKTKNQCIMTVISKITCANHLETLSVIMSAIKRNQALMKIGIIANATIISWKMKEEVDPEMAQEKMIESTTGIIETIESSVTRGTFETNGIKEIIV